MPMQVDLVDLLREEMIAVGLDCTNAEDVIRQLASLLIERDCVEDGFAEDVIDREKVYPTGLPTRPVAVALPHADPDHVKKTSLALGVLRSPVAFGEMGSDGSTTVQAKIVILMAIKEREKQVKMLQAIARVFQSPDVLASLAATHHRQEALQVLLSYLPTDPEP